MSFVFPYRSVLVNAFFFHYKQQRASHAYHVSAQSQWREKIRSLIEEYNVAQSIDSRQRRQITPYIKLITLLNGANSENKGATKKKTFVSPGWWHWRREAEHLASCWLDTQGRETVSKPERREKSTTSFTVPGTNLAPRHRRVKDKHRSMFLCLWPVWKESKKKKEEKG